MLEDTNTNEVISVIRNLISKTSCGLDGIFTIMLKYIAEAVACPLTRIINKSFHYGTVPLALKFS